MSEEEKPLTEQAEEAIARHKTDKKVFGKNALVAVTIISLLLASVFATLFWANSQENVGKLAQSNDAQISQFEYCKTAPKTDPRCQDAVSKPAEKVVEGPQGVQGIQGISGIQGPQGPKGEKGDSGPPPPCVLQANRCVGPAGAQGIQGVPGQKGAAGAIGPKGEQGVEGPEGVKGETGARGETGERGLACSPDIEGCRGPKGDPGQQGLQGETGSDTAKVRCEAAGGDFKPMTVVTPDDPNTPAQDPGTAQIDVCVVS